MSAYLTGQQTGQPQFLVQTVNPTAGAISSVLAAAAAVASAQAQVTRQTIGAVEYSATLGPLILTENIIGVIVTTTFGENTITEVYGAPFNETWVTTISDEAITKERSA